VSSYLPLVQHEKRSVHSFPPSTTTSSRESLIFFPCCALGIPIMPEPPEKKPCFFPT
jgi:hypothetical protein